jgi:hypothetical protein
MAAKNNTVEGQYAALIPTNEEPPLELIRKPGFGLGLKPSQAGFRIST